MNKYNAKEVEEKWQKYWEDNKTYTFDINNPKPIYAVDTPPPYISGKMHIGHAYSYSQQDFIARYKRLNNHNVFYPFGTDDNGLPTERYVEKKNKIKSKSMSRAEFIELCLKTLNEMTPIFIKDWKDMGISCDFDIYYSTIDKKTQKVSQKSFIDLYNNKHIVKQEFPTLWCPECQTTIAQAELEDKELPSLFSTLRFKVDGKDLLIATTRPELLGACVAVFVHPDDDRYKNLIGKNALVPVFDFEVPIIADESAQIDKGTGVLMICSYGDKYDAEAISRHKLKPKVILEKDGRINFGEYKGMKVKQAREQILEDLKRKNLITEQKEIKHIVNVHDKCGTCIEFIITEQWFIKLLDKKEQLIEQGKKVNWYPQFMFKRYENWVKGLDWDWSISRDRHFGIPIPVWVCPQCKEVILPDEDELPVDPLQTKKMCTKCDVEAKGETRVLDTWATSSLTPQIAANLIDNKIKIPFSLRPQAHDIIRTWAFYTIAKSFLHSNEIPWKDIVISGYVTMGGEKMSKSKGNVVEPRKLIDKFSVDALRYAASISKLGEDADFQEKDMVTAKKLVNKIWNASKFTFMHLKDYTGKPEKLELMDLWLLAKLNKTIASTTAYFDDYAYSKARSEAETFFKNTFCDNYLEIIKDRIYNPDVRGIKERQSAQYTLYTSLLAVLKMLAPIVPHITEEVYSHYYKEKESSDSIHTSEWPQVNNEDLDGEAENIGDIIVDVICSVRKFKSDNSISLKEPLKSITINIDNSIFDKLPMGDLKATTKAQEIKLGKKESDSLIEIER